MENLLRHGHSMIERTDMRMQRSMHTSINWMLRLIEINGARGVGKTTLMLQKAKELLEEDPASVFYASLDHPYFYENSIIDTAELFVDMGGKYLFLDEVHKYPPKQPGFDWSAEIKVIYDSLPDLHIIYSGSSLLHLYLGHGDLSRRKCTYNLQGLSFREYLNWYHGLTFDPVKLDDLLKSHTSMAKDIASQVKPLPAFKEYLRTGYYPFYKEAPEHYYTRINKTINVILEQDVPAVCHLAGESNIKLKKMLSALSHNVPYTPNLANLRSTLYIADHRTLMNYMQTLENAELINLLEKEARGLNKLQKPEKIYLNNTNLMHSLLLETPNIGNIRETFFLNQTRKVHLVTYAEKGDFMVDKRYTFEIGGKNKTGKQVKTVHESFIAMDDVESAYGKTIPLWMFGLLY